MAEPAPLSLEDVRNRVIVDTALSRMRGAADKLRGGDLAFAAKELNEAAAGCEALADGAVIARANDAAIAP